MNERLSAAGSATKLFEDRLPGFSALMHKPGHMVITDLKPAELAIF